MLLREQPERKPNDRRCGSVQERVCVCLSLACVVGDRALWFYFSDVIHFDVCKTSRATILPFEDIKQCQDAFSPFLKGKIELGVLEFGAARVAEHR